MKILLLCLKELLSIVKRPNSFDHNFKRENIEVVLFYTLAYTCEYILPFKKMCLQYFFQIKLSIVPHACKAQELKLLPYALLTDHLRLLLISWWKHD